MYAITETSYRVIGDASELQPGETAAEELPVTLLTTLQATTLRQQRNMMLTACDWTQGNDSPLAANLKTAWATYRQALRDVPQQSGFPATFTWPIAP